MKVNSYVLLIDPFFQINYILYQGDFISLVPIEHTHPFTAEICRVLVIMIVINHILKKYPNILSTLHFKIGSDCQLVLDNL